MLWLLEKGGKLSLEKQRPGLDRLPVNDALDTRRLIIRHEDVAKIEVCVPQDRRG